jgi:hypothetical protein
LGRDVDRRLLWLEVVGGVFDGEEVVAGGDLIQGEGEFFDGGEGVAGALDEEGGLGDLREVFGAELSRFVGRVQRIGEQEQSVGGFGIFCEEHAGLAAAVGVSGEDYAGLACVSRRLTRCRHHVLHKEFQLFCDLAEAFAVCGGGAGMRWSVRAKLAEREIEAEDGEVGGG